MGSATVNLLIILAVAWALRVTRKLKRLQQPGDDEMGYGNSYLGGKAEKDGNERKVCHEDEKNLRSESGICGNTDVPELETQEKQCAWIGTLSKQQD